MLRQGREAEAIDAYKAFLAGGGSGENAERVRRILEQIAPEALPEKEEEAREEGDEVRDKEKKEEEASP